MITTNKISFDEANEIISDIKNRGNSDLTKVMHQAVDRVLKESGYKLKDVAAIAVGTPGVVDQKTGIVSIAGTISALDGVNLAELIRQEFGIYPTVENDINLTNNLEVNNIQQTSANQKTLSTTAAQTITQFDGSVFSSGKLIVQVRDNVTSEVQVCQISIIHDTVTASTTEYSNLFTGANSLASFTATIRGADVHLDAAGASANSTTYKVLKTLIRFL